MKDKLRIGMQLLADLEVVRTKVVPCFPPHYNILQFFIDQYALIANNNVLNTDILFCRWSPSTMTPHSSLEKYWFLWNGWIVSARK